MESIINAAQLLTQYKNYNNKLYNKIYKFYQNKSLSNNFKLLLLNTVPYSRNGCIHYQKDLLLLTLTVNNKNEKRFDLYSGEKNNIFIAKNYQNIEECISDILLETCQNKYISAKFTNYKIIDIKKFNSTLHMLSFI